MPSQPGRFLAALLLLTLPTAQVAAGSTPSLPGQGCPTAGPTVPETRRETLVETAFGQAVPDPYRWLEAPARRDPAVSNWVAAQDGFARSYLAALPGRAHFAESLRALYAIERFGLPRKAGRTYFYSRKAATDLQARLYARKGIEGAETQLVDPSRWSRDASRTLEEWAPSRRGRYLVYATADRGSDWRTLHLVDVGSGRELPDTLSWLNDSTLGWIGDEGFLYARYPAPPAGREHEAPLLGSSVWYHRVGTPQSADEAVFATPDNPGWVHRVSVTSDSRMAVITSRTGTDSRSTLRVIDLKDRKGAWPVRDLVTGFAHEWRVLDGIGTRLWAITNRDAPRSRLVRIDLSEPEPLWREVVSERKGEVLERGHIVGNRLVLSYSRDGSSHAVVADLDGNPRRTIALNAIGAASGFEGRPGDAETFYQFSSFAQPPAIYRFDLLSGEIAPFALPQAPFDPDRFVVEERSARSADGTRVPYFLVRSREAAAAGKPVPTLLYGYGGFDVSVTPAFTPMRMAWLLAGGAFALAEVRGGGEFGADWHEAGRLANKPNAFADFIAVGDDLIARGVTPRGGLAAQGASNGGLLVAAAAGARPDLFAAINADAGVYDMLRYDRFTSGRFWTDEYGRPDREEDWRVLNGYSPYHAAVRRQRPGVWPATLLTAGDSDDRVIPAHSYKYAAALQAAPLGERPRLLRVEPDSGHAGPRATDRAAAAGADVLAFLACWTGLGVP